MPEKEYPKTLKHLLIFGYFIFTACLIIVKIYSLKNTPGVLHTQFLSFLFVLTLIIGAFYIIFQIIFSTKVKEKNRRYGTFISFSIIVFGLGKVAELYFDVIKVIFPIPIIVDVLHIMYFPFLVLGLFFIFGKKDSNHTLIFEAMVFTGVVELVCFMLTNVFNGSHALSLGIFKTRYVLLYFYIPIRSFSLVFLSNYILLKQEVSARFAFLSFGVLAMFLGDLFYFHNITGGDLDFILHPDFLQFSGFFLVTLGILETIFLEDGGGVILKEGPITYKRVMYEVPTSLN